ncbi:hypothetical protein ACYZDC_001139 [Yersinia enterocolitica]
MNNIEELKKAALGANLHGWTGFEDALNADGYSEAVSKFIGHCSPSAILALIAQLEASRAVVTLYDEKLATAEAALSAANEKPSKPVVLPRVAAIHAALTDVARHRTSVENIRDVVEAIKAAGGKVEGE